MFGDLGHQDVAQQLPLLTYALAHTLAHVLAPEEDNDRTTECREPLFPLRNRQVRTLLPACLPACLPEVIGNAGAGQDDLARANLQALTVPTLTL